MTSSRKPLEPNPLDGVVCAKRERELIVKWLREKEKDERKDGGDGSYYYDAANGIEAGMHLKKGKFFK